MAQVIVVTSGKGGVGKTTSSAAFATGLAQRGKKTVVIDFDVGLRNLDLIMGVERRVVFDIVNVISGEAPFVAGGTLGGLLSGFDAHGLAYLRHHRPDAPVVTVPTQTIRQVLDNAHAPPVIDYWSLDTEGSELALLHSFPWDRYTFRVLTVEHNHHHHRREAIRCLMESKGFARFCEFAIDDCYVNTRLGLSGGGHSGAWR